MPVARSRLRPRELANLALLFLVYFGAAKIGLKLDAVSGFATLVWAPSGIALAALYLFGMRLFPAVTAAALLVNLSVGASPLAAVGIAIGNTLEAVVGAHLLRRRGFLPSLSRVHDVVSLVVFGALISTLLSATIGVLSLWLSGALAATAIRATWAAWWVGDALGDLIVAPIVMTVYRFRCDIPKLTRRRIAEIAAFGVALAVLGLILFEEATGELLRTVQLPYLVIPMIIVLLMDLQMPVMDGYEAATALRSEGYRAPIIALTAHAQKEERQRCLRSGFDDHLAKPVNREALVESIAYYRGKARSGAVHPA